MKYVYKLIHKHLVEDEAVYDTKIIGFYSSIEKAKETIEKYKKITGFKDYKSGFEVEKCEIDEDDFDFS